MRQGVRSEDDHRRELWRSFLRFVEAIRPRAVLMENVPDMARGGQLRGGSEDDQTPRRLWLRSGC